MFYEHSMDTMFTDVDRSDGETFYYHCDKFYVPMIARMTLDQLICGIGAWIIQGFECRNKQSKHVYERKTNGKVNCCEQVLKGLHHMFVCTS